MRRRRRKLAAAIAAALAGLLHPASSDARLDVHVASSTAYCDHGTMADGSWTRLGSVASNRHPLGTRITLTRRGPGGRRHWIVRDRIGWGSDLDFWMPTCSAAITWGRRHIAYRIGWAR